VLMIDVVLPKHQDRDVHDSEYPNRGARWSQKPLKPVHFFGGRSDRPFACSARAILTFCLGARA
jgi:hypothetical protein